MATTMTPEMIQGKLFYFRDAAHKFHLDTRSFAEHKALDFAYTELVGYVDGISEMLMGYIGKRIGKLKMDDVPAYSHDEVTKMATEIKDFAYQLYEWAGEKKYCDIENTAQALSGMAAKLSYLLTLT